MAIFGCASCLPVALTEIGVPGFGSVRTPTAEAHDSLADSSRQRETANQSRAPALSLREGVNLEAAMVAKQSSQNDKQSGEKTKKQQEFNLGQKEAGQEKEKKSELSNMGEKSRESQRGS
jgi:pantothenate synthetase